MTITETQVQQAAAALTAAEKVLNELLNQKIRCEQAAIIGSNRDTEIAELRQQKADTQGKAFLSVKQADTSNIDAQLTELEQQSAADRATAQAAKSAAGLLIPQIEDAQLELESAQSDLYTACAASTMSTFSEAEADYEIAATALKAALSKMAAAAALHSHLTGLQGAHHIVDNLIAALGGNAHGLVQNGLQVKRSNGYMTDSYISSGRLQTEISAALMEMKAALRDQGARL